MRRPAVVSIRTSMYVLAVWRFPRSGSGLPSWRPVSGSRQPQRLPVDPRPPLCQLPHQVFADGPEHVRHPVERFAQAGPFHVSQLGLVAEKTSGA